MGPLGSIKSTEKAKRTREGESVTGVGTFRTREGATREFWKTRTINGCSRIGGVGKITKRRRAVQKEPLARKKRKAGCGHCRCVDETKRKQKTETEGKPFISRDVGGPRAEMGQTNPTTEIGRLGVRENPGTNVQNTKKLPTSKAEQNPPGSDTHEAIKHGPGGGGATLRGGGEGKGSEH